MQINIHRIQKVEVNRIREMVINETGEPFFVKTLKVVDIDNNSVEINLFSQSRELLVPKPKKR